MPVEQHKQPGSDGMTKRAAALFALATTLIALVYLCDSFGANIRSKGEPGWWEWSMAAVWSAYATYWWRKVVQHYRLWREQQSGP